MTTGLQEAHSAWRAYHRGETPPNDPSYADIIFQRKATLATWSGSQNPPLNLSSLLQGLEQNPFPPTQRIQRAIRLLELSKPIVNFGLSEAERAVKAALVHQAQDDIVRAFDELYGTVNEVAKATICVSTFDELVAGYHELLTQEPRQYTCDRYTILTTVLMQCQFKKLPEMVIALQVITYHIKFKEVLHTYLGNQNEEQAIEKLKELSTLCKNVLNSPSLSLLDRGAFLERERLIGKLQMLMICAQCSPETKTTLKTEFEALLKELDPPASSLSALFSQAMDALCDCFGSLKG